MTQKMSRENIVINIHGVVHGNKNWGGGICFIVVSLEANDEGFRDMFVVVTRAVLELWCLVSIGIFLFLTICELCKILLPIYMVTFWAKSDLR